MAEPIAVVARITAHPGQGDAVRAALRELIAPTLQEAGCERYELHVDPQHADTFLFIERWRDEQALDAHGRTPHLQRFAERMRELGALSVERWAPFTP